jgi:hypothetical protein
MTAVVAPMGIHTGGAVQGQNAEDEKEDVFPAMPEGNSRKKRWNKAP